MVLGAERKGKERYPSRTRRESNGRHRDWEYGSRGVQTSWPTPQGQGGEHRPLEELAEAKMKTLIEQIQTLMAQWPATQAQAGQAQEEQQNSPWGMPQPQQGVGMPSPQNSNRGYPTMGQGGMMTPGQQGFTSTMSPMGNSQSPMSRQTPGTPGQHYMPQQIPYTPRQERRDSWDVTMQARSADDNSTQARPKRQLD